MPATDESRHELEAAGLSAFEGQQPISEMEAQAILAANDVEDSTVEYGPRCFGSEYDPETMLCGGCVFAARCWQVDGAYLLRLKNGKALYPQGAPKVIVDDLLESLKPAVKKTRRRARPPTK